MRLTILSIVAVSILSMPMPNGAWAGTDAEYSGFLTNYDVLRPGPDGGVDEIWKNPDYNLPADFAKYNAIMIDPITIVDVGHVPKTSTLTVRAQIIDR